MLDLIAYLQTKYDEFARTKNSLSYQDSWSSADYDTDSHCFYMMNRLSTWIKELEKWKP